MLMAKEKENQNLCYSLANADPQKIEFLKKMQLFDYYSLLECRNFDIAQQNKAIEQQNKKLKPRR
jgi:hypothetical protein